MIYIYCPRRSETAALLRGMLGARRIRQENRLHRLHLGAQSLVINWGERTVPEFGDCKVLNEWLPRHKLEELQSLDNKELPVVQFRLGAVRPAEGWVGRKLHHQEGRDLLNPPTHPDYWVKWENIVREFRVHVLGGKAVRTGERLPRLPEGQHHPEIRSYGAGWYISYGRRGVDFPKGIRPLAVRAAGALGLEFAAVDLALTNDGRKLILEVNTAPGIEAGQTLDLYAQFFRDEEARLG